MHWTRRRLLGGFGSLLSLTMAPGLLRAAVPESGRLVFRAFRDGSPLGWHRLAFRREDGDLHVHIEIRFEVKLAFFTVYSYRHTNDEVWRDGRLVRLDTTTDDDGTEYRVHAEAEGDKLIVDGSEGRLELPGDTMTTSYWNEAAVERGEWLDTQKGTLARSEVTPRGPEVIEAGGRKVEANRYTLEGDIDCDLWYHEGVWSKLRFEARDATVDYVLQPPGEAGG